jgi:hypothetical protein
VCLLGCSILAVTDEQMKHSADSDETVPVGTAFCISMTRMNILSGAEYQPAAVMNHNTTDGVLAPSANSWWIPSQPLASMSNPSRTAHPHKAICSRTGLCQLMTSALD